MKKDFSKGDKNLPKSNISTNCNNLFENMDLGVSIFELIRDKEEIVNLHINYTNRKSILNKHKPNEEIIGRTIKELFEIDKKDYYLNMAREAISTEKSLRHEIYFENFNNYFLINAFSINKNLFVTFDLDITKEKKVEEELRDTFTHLEIEKRQLSAIVDNIPVGIIIAEAPSGKFLLANKQIAKIWRYPQTDSADEFKKYKGYYPDGRIYKPHEWPLSRSIRTGKVVKDEEIQISRGDGTKGWLSVSSVPVHDNGNIIMGIVIDLDITERKHAEESLKESRDKLEEQVKERTDELKKAYNLLKENEEKFRELFNKAIDTIVLSEFKENGMPGNFIEVNEAASKKLGYNKDEFRNMTPLDLFSPEKLDELPQIAAELHNKGFTTFEAISITKDRKEFPVEVNVHVFKLRGRNVALAIARDISERKKAEEAAKREAFAASQNAIALKESEGKFRALYDDNPSMYFTVDSELMILSVNQFGAELLGYRVSELISQPLSIVFYDEDGEFASKNLKNTLKNYGQVFHWELRKVRKDGSIIWVKETARAVKESDGNVVIYTVCEDITDRKKAEEALKESEKKFRELFNQATDMLSLTELNDDGTIKGYIEVNETASKRLGYSKEELLNMTPLDLYLDTSIIMKMVSELYEKGYSIAENIQITKEGMQIPVELNTHLFKLKGKNVVLSISRDITERKKAERALIESEEKLNATIESSPDSITVADLELKITSCNQATVVMYGASSKEEIIGLKILDLVVSKYHPLILETMNRLLREMKSFTLEVELFRKDNSVFPAEISANIIKDVKGNPTSFVGITKDITGRKNAEKERENLINELKRSNEELQQFAYIASHDLQEPLRTITSFTQLLELRYKDKLDKDADEFIEFIIDGTTRMQALIKDLLQYSRVQTKGAEFKRTDVQKALDQVLSNLKVSIEENNAEITYDELPTVYADEKQLIQLFQNLISNAIKFRKKEESPKIHISVRKDEKKSEYVFGVSDNGIGMEPEQNKRIFEIFQRLHTKEEYKGTGIGLAVAKKIVERHGGHIWVESEPGKGTTFYFTIPNP